jgi:FkbM family methyltransferase
MLPKSRRQICTTKHGAKLAMAPRVLDVYAAIKRKGGCWDPYVFDTCRGLLAPGNVFYDLGASVGYMTIEMATVFRGAVKCIAFEPQPDLARCIAISAHLNGVQDAVSVFEVMVGEAEREETLMLTSHSIHASVNALESGGQPLRRRMTSVDELVAEGAIPPPDVMKMDIEGGELQAIRGAQETIRQHQPHIAFEVNTCADRFGYTRKDLLDLIRSLGDYELFDIHPEASLHPAGDASAHDDVLARSVSRIRASS